MYQTKYNEIYTGYDQYGYLHLLFYNKKDKVALIFDGIKFVYKYTFTNIPSCYKLFKYPSKESIDLFYEIESIKQLGDVSLIKFKNGDIFQLYFMMDDHNSSQILSIFERERDSKISTPLGINLYDSILKKIEEGVECEIQIDN